jgi:hypothetical protein
MIYGQAKKQTYQAYKKVGKIYCPYLKRKIVFPSKGFWHMVYTSRNKKRNKRVQKLRFQLFKLAVRVLKITTTLQEYEQDDRKQVRYYGFIAIVDGWKIKVIVKKVGHGQPYFWSVIPNWRTRRRADKKIRVLFKGKFYLKAIWKRISQNKKSRRTG